MLKVAKDIYMNKVILIGNLTRDIELYETQDGKHFARFGIAVDRYDKQTDFFTVKVWNGLADNCAKFLKKGSRIAVVGLLSTYSFEDANGNKRNGVEILASEIDFLPSGQPKQEAVKTEAKQEKATAAKPKTTKKLSLQKADDDLPF